MQYNFVFFFIYFFYPPVVNPSYIGYTTMSRAPPIPFKCSAQDICRYPSWIRCQKGYVIMSQTLAIFVPNLSQMVSVRWVRYHLGYEGQTPDDVGWFMWEFRILDISCSVQHEFRIFWITVIMLLHLCVRYCKTDDIFNNVLNTIFDIVYRQGRQSEHNKLNSLKLWKVLLHY